MAVHRLIGNERELKWTVDDGANAHASAISAFIYGNVARAESFVEADPCEIGMLVVGIFGNELGTSRGGAVQRGERLWNG